MLTPRSNLKFFDKPFSGKLFLVLSASLALLGSSAFSADAQVIRRGPNGREVTTERTVEDGQIIRTTTGPNGESREATATIDEDGNLIRTGPNGNSSTTERTVEDGQVTREVTGPRGNTWSVIRERNRR
ncbi:MAG: hypothetical protein ACFB16_04750 [Phormidesmis sp.]